LGIAGVGLAWMFFGQQVGIGPSEHWLQPETTEKQWGGATTTGIAGTWHHSNPSTENAALNQQEALLLANQREPDASNAKKVVPRYALVDCHLEPGKAQKQSSRVVYGIKICIVHWKYA